MRKLVLLLLCIAPYGSAAAQGSAPRAFVGAYYFDGWAGAWTSQHFRGLLHGRFSSREPLVGWRDDHPAAVDAQLVQAHRFGIDFFAFDWYYNADTSPFPTLNKAEREYRSLPRHHGVEYALTYVNNGRWAVPPSAWQSVVTRWVVREFSDPDYVRVNGEPLLIVLDVQAMQSTWGGAAGVNQALAILRATARAHGFPGVFVLAGAQLSGYWPDVRGTFVQGDAYDALTSYGYTYVFGQAELKGHAVRAGAHPFRQLRRTSIAVWALAARRSPIPYVPVVMGGWDPRPWHEPIGAGGPIIWFSRTPAQFGSLAAAAIASANRYPHLRVSVDGRPLVLVCSWNELGEGSDIVPTRGDANAYGLALRRVLFP